MGGWVLTNTTISGHDLTDVRAFHFIFSACYASTYFNIKINKDINTKNKYYNQTDGTKLQQRKFKHFKARQECFSERIFHVYFSGKRITTSFTFALVNAWHHSKVSVRLLALQDNIWRIYIVADICREKKEGQKAAKGRKC